MSDAKGNVYKTYGVDLTDLSLEEIGALRWLVNIVDKEILSKLPVGDQDRRWNLCNAILLKAEDAFEEIMKENIHD